MHVYVSNDDNDKYYNIALFNDTVIGISTVIGLLTLIILRAVMYCFMLSLFTSLYSFI